MASTNSSSDSVAYRNVILTLSKWLVEFNPKAKRMIVDALGFGIKRVEKSKGASDVNNCDNTAAAAVDLAMFSKPPLRTFTFRVEAMGSGVVLVDQVTLDEDFRGSDLKKKLEKLLPGKPHGCQRLFFGHDGPEVEDEVGLSTQYKNSQDKLGNTLVLALCKTQIWAVQRFFDATRSGAFQRGSYIDPNDMTTWHGVKINTRFSEGPRHRVVQLDAPGANMTGRLPPEIWESLPYLRELTMQGNHYLTGPLPSEIGLLAKLRVLMVHNTGLSGLIPKELSNLTKLRYIWMSETRLEMGPGAPVAGDGDRNYSSKKVKQLLKYLKTRPPPPESES